MVGLSSPDDSAIYKINDEQAIITTVDFFPPVVDDAYDFGAIAAANALSDVFAMGGEPIMAVNLVAYPDGYGLELLREILRGGAEKTREELNHLIDHLSKSTGLGGKSRKMGSTSEKARTAVTWRIRSAIKKIEKVLPPLGKHLTNAVQTGTYFAYCPEKEMYWQL